MAFKIMLVCASALLVQVYSQCVPGSALVGGYGAPYGYGTGVALDGFAGYGNNAGCGCGGVASTGGGLLVSSASPFSPSGLSVMSENVYEGGLIAAGNLPFLGTVALESTTVPTAGVGAVSYGCGDGVVGIVAEEGPIVTGITVPGSYGPGIGAIAGPGIVGGLGCGLGGNSCGAGLGYGFGGIGNGAGVGCGLEGIGYGLGGNAFGAGLGYGLGGMGYGAGVGCGLEGIGYGLAGPAGIGYGFGGCGCGKY